MNRLPDPDSWPPAPPGDVPEQERVASWLNAGWLEAGWLVSHVGDAPWWSNAFSCSVHAAGSRKSSNGKARRLEGPDFDNHRVIGLQHDLEQAASRSDFPAFSGFIE